VAHAVSRRSVTAEAWVRAGSVHVGLVVDTGIDFFQFFDVPCQYHSTEANLGDEQQSCWWPQSRGSVLPRRHEQQYIMLCSLCHLCELCSTTAVKIVKCGDSLGLYRDRTTGGCVLLRSEPLTNAANLKPTVYFKYFPI
jgi:hypothetical protein